MVIVMWEFIAGVIVGVIITLLSKYWKRLFEAYKRRTNEYLDLLYLRYVIAAILLIEAPAIVLYSMEYNDYLLIPLVIINSIIALHLIVLEKCGGDGDG